MAFQLARSVSYIGPPLAVAHQLHGHEAYQESEVHSVVGVTNTTPHLLSTSTVWSWSLPTRRVSYLENRVAVLTLTLHLRYYTNWMFMGLASRVS